MRIRLFPAPLVFALVAVVACVTARVPASLVSEVWTPASLSTDEFESHPAFSADGSVMLFVRSRADFTRWRILESDCLSGGWSAPRSPSFSGDGVEADPFFAADGRVFFISSRHAPGKSGDDLDIWYTRRSGSSWAEPTRLPEPVNSPGAEWFPRFVAGTLYFGSDRPGGFGATDLYKASQAVDGAWSVENLGPPLSTEGDEYEFEISPRNDFAIVMADRGQAGGRLYRTRRHGAHWSELEPVTQGGAGFQVGPLLSRDGATLLFAQVAPGRSGEIMRLRLRPGRNDSWGRCG